MAVREYQIRVAGESSGFVCREDEFVLAAMVRANQGPVRHGCHGGGCGVCKMRVDFGEYDIEKRMSRAHISELEQNDGWVLICCIKPRGDMILRGEDNGN